MIHSEIGEFDWLKQWARLAPKNVAFKDGDNGRSYTYAELYQLSVIVGEKLVGQFDLKPGDRIAMLATNELEAVVLFFASLRCGSVLVPINFRLTRREIDHVTADSEPKVILVQNAFTEIVNTLESKKNNRMAVWKFEEFQTLVNTALSEVRAQKNPSSGKTATAISVNADQPCMILYTSGTTGSPKGAMITPRMLHWNSLNTTLRLNLSESDVFVNFLPFFHTGGWNVLLTPFVHRGATIVLTKKFDADHVLKLCESEKATIMFGVPTTMEMMSRSPLFEKADLTSVRYAIVGGEPMPIELIRTWQKKGVPIRQGFGLTEFGPNVFSLNEDDAIRKIGSIGFPNFYVEARIVDENRNDLKVGEIGELLLRGPVCTPGYWNNEKATQESIVDGWFHTGDLVRVDDDGFFYVAGRKKDMYISGGENVYPVEVENVLGQHPAVREVAVIGVPDQKWGEAGRAYVALMKNSQTSAEELLSYCKDKLAKFKIPKDVRFLEDLPKGDSGKILKRRLREIAPVVLVSLLTSWLTACQTPRYKEFENVRNGMSKADVLEAVGNPNSTQRRYGKDQWEYRFNGTEGPMVRQVHFENGISIYVGPTIKPLVSAEAQDKINLLKNQTADVRENMSRHNETGEFQIQKFKEINESPEDYLTR